MSATLTFAAFLELVPVCAPKVHPETLASVIQAETRFRPFSVGINQNGRSISSRGYATKEQAVAAVSALIARGVTNLDIGPAQISLKAGHLQRRGLGPEAAFDPCTALEIAQDVLVDCWTRAPARETEMRQNQTFACYNSGTWERPSYVQNVRSSAAMIVPALRIAGLSQAAGPIRSDDPAPAAFRSDCGPMPFDFGERSAWRACRKSPPDDGASGAPPTFRPDSTENSDVLLNTDIPMEGAN